MFVALAMACASQSFANDAEKAAAAVESASTAAAPAAAPSSPETSPAAEAAAPAAEPAKPAPKPVTLVANIDLTTQRMHVVADGKSIHSWPISSGREGFETPAGRWKASWMAKTWFSRQYDDAPMPHAVFFHNGMAVHATQATGQLGRAASHGCIRLSPANAEVFYNLVRRHGLTSTEFRITGKAKTPPPAVARALSPQQTVRMYAPPYVQYAPRPAAQVAVPVQGLIWPGDRPPQRMISRYAAPQPVYWSR